MNTNETNSEKSVVVLPTTPAPKSEKSPTPKKANGKGKKAQAAAPAKKANGKAKVDTSRVITSVKPNPKRPTGAAFARYALYKKGMTVQKALDAGVWMQDITYDARKGHIELSKSKS